MAEKEAIYSLVFKVADRERQNALKALQSLTDESVRLHVENLATGESARELGNSLQKLLVAGRAYDELTSDAGKLRLESLSTADAMAEVARTTRDFNDAKRNVEGLTDSLREAGRVADNTAGRLDRADEGFDVVSRRVGLAGDVQSNIGAVRGLAELSGLEKQADVVGIAGELVVLTEELPRLKYALQNMPDVVKFAAQELGAKGVGLVGALGALAAITIIASNAASKEREQKAAMLEAEERFADFALTSTYEEALARQVQLEKEIDNKRTRLDAVNTELEKSDREVSTLFGDAIGSVLGDNKLTSAISGVASEIVKLETDLGLLRGSEQALEDESSRLTAALSENITEYNLLTQGIVDGTFAANTAAKELELIGQQQVAYYQRTYELEDRYQTLVTEGSKEEFDNTLKQLELDKEIANRRLEEMTALRDSYTNAGQAVPEAVQESFQQAQATFDNLSRSIAYLTETAEPLVKTREAETKALDNLNSAHEAHEKMVAREISALQERVQAEAEFSQFARGADAEAVQARIQALQDEKAALEAMLPELERLAPTSETAAAELARVQAELEGVNANIGKTSGLGANAARINEQESFTQDVLEIEQARDSRILEIRAQTAKKEAELLSDLTRSLQDAELDASRERVDAARERADALAELEADGQRQREDIIKKFNRSTSQAVSDRDAEAFKNAERARDDELEDLSSSLDEQRAEIERAYQEQLQTIQLELDRQRQNLQLKYQQQLSDLQLATQNQINAERQKAQQELSTRQQAYQQELALLNSFSQQGVLSISTFAQTASQQLQLFAQTALATMAQINQASVVAQGIGGLSGRAGGITVGQIQNIVEGRISDILSEVF